MCVCGHELTNRDEEGGSRQLTKRREIVVEEIHCTSESTRIKERKIEGGFVDWS